MNVFERAQENSGLSGVEIGKKTDLDRSTICRAIHEPGRSRIETIISVGTVIGMEEQEIITAWREDRKKRKA